MFKSKNNPNQIEKGAKHTHLPTLHAVDFFFPFLVILFSVKCSGNGTSHMIDPSIKHNYEWNETKIVCLDAQDPHHQYHHIEIGFTWEFFILDFFYDLFRPFDSTFSNFHWIYMHMCMCEFGFFDICSLLYA